MKPPPKVRCAKSKKGKRLPYLGGGGGLAPEPQNARKSVKMATLEAWFSIFPFAKSPILSVWRELQRTRLHAQGGGLVPFISHFIQKHIQEKESYHLKVVVCLTLPVNRSKNQAQLTRQGS